MNEHVDHSHSEGHGPKHEPSSLIMYFGVFIALMVLTVLTVCVSRQHF